MTNKAEKKLSPFSKYRFFIENQQTLVFYFFFFQNGETMWIFHYNGICCRRKARDFVIFLLAKVQVINVCRHHKFPIPILGLKRASGIWYGNFKYIQFFQERYTKNTTYSYSEHKSRNYIYEKRLFFAKAFTAMLSLLHDRENFL